MMRSLQPTLIQFIYCCERGCGRRATQVVHVRSVDTNQRAGSKWFCEEHYEQMSGDRNAPKFEGGDF